MTIIAAPLQAFWLESADKAQVGLRRYRSSTEPESSCPADENHGYHDATVILGEALVHREEDKYGGHWSNPEYSWPDHDDPRWPAACACGYRFTEEDSWQDWWEIVYRRADTGEETTLRKAPDGAIWDAWWYPIKGPDGLSLVARCPGGHDWMIDGRASNCTLPQDTVHRCWVRHGTPPNLTVDKAGVTCAAGAGSIVAGQYHGFLRGGSFTPG